MAFLTTTANKLLDKILKNTDFTPASSLYLSLHTADPGQDGSNEVSGGSYARKSVAFDSAASKATQNTADVEFTGMPSATVTHVGIWSALSGGTLWWTGALSASKTVGAGDSLKFPAGDIDVTLT